MMVDEFRWISQQVEHVIKEQNMLDAFAMIENYCDLLIERAVLLKNRLVSPSTLKVRVLYSIILIYGYWNLIPFFILRSTDLHVYSCLYRECHDELKEGISSLIFAASRCGEFPELQKIRQMLTSRFGKDFADCAVELRNKCRVNPKVKSGIV
jgi:hypothetical protein